MSILETAVEISAEVHNHRLTAFSVELLANDKPKELILEFYEYWGNMDSRSGVWIDECTYAFDCDEDNVEDGILFCEDNILEMYAAFIQDMLPKVLEVRKLKLDRLFELSQ